MPGFNQFGEGALGEQAALFGSVTAPPARLSVSIPAPGFTVSPNLHPPPLTYSLSISASVRVSVYPGPFTLRVSLPRPHLVGATVGIDVPTQLFLRRHPTTLALGRRARLRVERQTVVGLRGPTALGLFEVRDRLHLHRRLSELELDMPTVLVLERHERELVLDG